MNTKKILTAMANTTLNKELKRYIKYEVSEEDLYYQEAVIEELAKYKYDVLLVSGLLQGEFEFCEFLEKIKNMSGEIRVIVVTDEVNNFFKRQLAEYGVIDVFSDSKVSFDDIVDAIDREEPILKKCAKEKNFHEENKKEVVNVVQEENKEYSVVQKQEIVTISGINGAGKTTVAVNLSKTLSKKTNSKILLIDLDTLNGNMDEVLDINKVPQNVKIILDEDKKCGLNYAAELIDKNRFDANIFEELIIKVGNIDVLTGNTSLHYCQNVLGEKHYNKILECAKEKYDFIIIDTSSNIFLDSTKWGLQVANKIIFVTESNYLSMKKSTQLLKIISKNWGTWKEKIKILVNKESNQTLSADVVEQILEEYRLIGSIKYAEENMEHSYLKILEEINYIPKSTIISKILMMKNLKEFAARNTTTVNG